MRRWLTLLARACAVCTLAAATVAVPPALAAGNAVVNDCQTNGKLTGSYTLAELRHALAIMPASVKEYTNCPDVITQAENSALSTGHFVGGAGKGSGGSFLPTPVIVILVLLALAAVTFGAVAIRRRRAAENDGGGEDDGAGESGGGGGGPAAR
jgi:acyl-CoA reductase-like NAD-dependent aldehyde dehydrogenase